MEDIVDKIPTNFREKTDQKYSCKLCDFNTCKKSTYYTHLKGVKHKSMLSVDKNMDQLTKNHGLVDKIPTKTDPHLTCICGKHYNSRQGLWKHKLTCEKENIRKLNESGTPPENNDNNEEEKEEDTNFSLPKELSDPSILQIIMMLVKDNSEFKKIMAEQSAAMIEIAKNSCNQSHNNNNNNNNNKTFNLQFFLNETCKNAMNIDEFINRLKIEVEDLENMGNVGYVQGISSIINKNMNTLDVTERPIHCTDLKRGTIHIKDNNVWEKDDQENTMTRKAISKISTKTILSMKKFREKYPDCESSNSRHSNKYNRICREACGGEGDNVVEKDNKIIHNIIKKVVVEKIKDE